MLPYHQQVQDVVTALRFLFYALEHKLPATKEGAKQSQAAVSEQMQVSMVARAAQYDDLLSKYMIDVGE